MLIKRYFSSSPISASVDPPSRCCPVYSISEILVLTRFVGAIAANRRRIARQLTDPSVASARPARRSLIVAAAKLETAGTRSRWPGLTSRVSRLTMLQFSLSAPIHRYSDVKHRTRAPGKKNCGAMHEFTALECPEVAKWSLGDCDSAFRPRPLKITDIAIIFLNSVTITYK